MSKHNKVPRLAGFTEAYKRNASNSTPVSERYRGSKCLESRQGSVAGLINGPPTHSQSKDDPCPTGGVKVWSPTILSHLRQGPYPTICLLLSRCKSHMTSRKAHPMSSFSSLAEPQGIHLPGVVVKVFMTRITIGMIYPEIIIVQGR